MNKKLRNFIAIIIMLLMAVPAIAGTIGYEEKALLYLINSYRANHGLTHLSFSDSLISAASGHSRDMSVNDYFAHNSLNGASFSDRIKASGYDINTYLGENIAAGMWKASDVFNAWKNSPKHNEVMLGRQFRTIGIRRAFNPESTYIWYWTADFGGSVDSPSEAVINFDTNNWAYTYMSWLADNKGVGGYKNGSFRLENPITRAEFAVMLAKALGIASAKQNLFKDTSNHWSKYYVTALVQKNIISGYVNDRFRPDDLLTRAEMAEIATNAGHLRAGKTQASFKDIQGHWAQSAIVTAAANDVVNGYPSGKFRPNAVCTRADSAAMIYRLIN